MKAGLCSLSLPAGEGRVVELWERRTDDGLGFGFRIISRKGIWFEKGEYMYLIKRNKSDLKIKKKNADVENCGESIGFGYIYIYIYILDMLSICSLF